MSTENINSVPELVSCLKEGDRDAFHQLYELFATKILCTCKKMYLTHEDAEEVVQEVFLKVWEKRQGLDCTLSFNAYLFTMMRSSIFKRSRKQALEIAYQKYQLNYGERETGSVELELEYEELKHFSEKAIAALPKGQQEVFKLKFTEHLTADEIAGRLQLSKRTVENQLYKATKRLKQEFSSSDLIPSDLFVFLLFF
ncbi:RNA polymerase sigma-70 factor, ECF subfamily [Cyclobacterium xiamenense]|uniref:RNA polymerase sigma-70 factor, ECF subfamily n=1 Tax=Cyclobacterium xiamenense TaxID=1297121 RepID=A0A1H6UVH6_9BACT|nr:sigma-70 family RNA polymerase sigma factor [Cyclobacterium xiamenense]SEI92075.1 RNA polymerase sigma-70 factor, ECF subfamily [Cyclobacterium xiamenense]